MLRTCAKGTLSRPANSQMIAIRSFCRFSPSEPVHSVNPLYGESWKASMRRMSSASLTMRGSPNSDLGGSSGCTAIFTS